MKKRYYILLIIVLLLGLIISIRTCYHNHKEILISPLPPISETILGNYQNQETVIVFSVLYDNYTPPYIINNDI